MTQHPTSLSARALAALRTFYKCARFLAFAGILAPLAVGCGAELSTPFPDALVDDEGNTIYLEDVEAITSNPNLSDEQRRARLRELGIEDEELIDALLSL